MEHELRRDERRDMSNFAAASRRGMRQWLSIVRIERQSCHKRFLGHFCRLFLGLPLRDRLGNIGESNREATFGLQDQIIGIGETHLSGYLSEGRSDTFVRFQGGV